MGQVIHEGYDDPHVQEFGLVVGKDKPVDLRYFGPLVRPLAVRRALDKHGFIEVHFDQSRIPGDEANDKVYAPLAISDSDISFFGSSNWEPLCTGEDYDPTTLIPHIDGDHIALVAAQGKVRNSLTGLVGRKAGVTATAEALEEFLNEDGWHRPFQEVAATHLKALRVLADSDEERAPAKDIWKGVNSIKLNGLRTFCYWSDIP
jgi:hypothetical protein